MDNEKRDSKTENFGVLDMTREDLISENEELKRVVKKFKNSPLISKIVKESILIK
jgi:hypothetical protein